MFGYVRHALVNPLVRLWLATSEQSWRRLPRPVDSSTVHAPGADADRLLLMGSGIAVGYGVMSHDLALAGNLARALSARTGRGVSIDVAVGPDITPTTARRLLPDLDLDRFDAVVLSIGGLEGLTLMPAEMWRLQLTELLDQLRASATPSLKIFLVETGVPLLSGLPPLSRSLVSSQVARLNRESQQLCAVRGDATFVAFDPAQGDLNSLAGRSTYVDWARLIAPRKP